MLRCRILVVNMAIILQLPQQNLARDVRKFPGQNYSDFLSSFEEMWGDKSIIHDLNVAFEPKSFGFLRTFWKNCEALISKTENKNSSKKNFRRNIFVAVKREWATRNTPSKICLKLAPPPPPPGKGAQNYGGLFLRNFAFAVAEIWGDKSIIYDLNVAFEPLSFGFLQTPFIPPKYTSI